MAARWGATILGCAGTRLSKDEAAFFKDANPFGFILFARNIENPDQVLALSHELRCAVGWQAPIFIDQEGGRVQRLCAPYWTQWSPPLDMLSQTANPARAMWIRSRLIAHELRLVGIDGNCAPCVDIAYFDTHLFLKNRCYGFNAHEVSQNARAAADGLLAGGVLPVMKHLPGHGRARLDSHKALPKVNASADELRKSDFAAFRPLQHLPLAMTAHIIYTNIDPDTPATQSKIMIDEIRQNIGFEGLLMSDDINMHALSGLLGERSQKTLKAGCDIVLHCSGELSEMKEVAFASGQLSLQGQERALRALKARQIADDCDVGALRSELDSLYRDISAY